MIEERCTVSEEVKGTLTSKTVEAEGRRNRTVNNYALLARFLSPWKSADAIETLRQQIRDGAVAWENLLLLANHNLCTPLWYVQLQNDGFLNLMPDELQQYLQALYEANVERNDFFHGALKELQQQFQEANIGFILLKGGAALCDNLYNDPGARLLQDLDILVRPGQAQAAKNILTDLGFQTIPDPGKEFDNLPTDQRHHHLHAMKKSGTPVVVEIHYRLGYAISGEILSNRGAWENSVEIPYNGRKMRILNPTCRLLHNGAHGLIAEASFIKGLVSLQQLSDFVFLAKRYQKKILWHDWLSRGREQGLATEFQTYLFLAHQFMHMPLPAGFVPARIAQLHSRRIAAACSYCLSQGEKDMTGWQKIRAVFLRMLVRSYYLLHLPAWVWRNVCYTEGGGNIFLRMKYLCGKTLSARSRAKI